MMDRYLVAKSCFVSKTPCIPKKIMSSWAEKIVQITTLQYVWIRC